jgi:hypothetical protein
MSAALVGHLANLLLVCDPGAGRTLGGVNPGSPPRHSRRRGSFNQPGNAYLTVAVPKLVIPYTATVSAPVVGIRTGVLAATGKPVEPVTPEPPMKADAELLINTPSASGTLPTVHTSVAACLQTSQVSVGTTTATWIKAR